MRHSLTLICISCLILFSCNKSSDKKQEDPVPEHIYDEEGSYYPLVTGRTWHYLDTATGGLPPKLGYSRDTYFSILGDTVKNGIMSKKVRIESYYYQTLSASHLVVYADSSGYTLFQGDTYLPPPGVHFIDTGNLALGRIVELKYLTYDTIIRVKAGAFKCAQFLKKTSVYPPIPNSSVDSVNYLYTYYSKNIGMIKYERRRQDGSKSSCSELVSFSR